MERQLWTTRWASEADFAAIGEPLDHVYVLEGFVPESARPFLRNVASIAAAGSPFVATTPSDAPRIRPRARS